MNPLDEKWRIGDEPYQIVTVTDQFVANCQSMSIESYPDGDIDRDIAITHHIISVHNSWVERSGKLDD